MKVFAIDYCYGTTESATVTDVFFRIPFTMYFVGWHERFVLLRKVWHQGYYKWIVV